MRLQAVLSSYNWLHCAVTLFIISPWTYVARLPTSVLPEICLRRVHNEIHNSRKPDEALPSEVFQVVAKVIKGQRAGKGFLDQSTKGTLLIEAQRALCPWLEA